MRRISKEPVITVQFRSCSSWLTLLRILRPSQSLAAERTNWDINTESRVRASRGNACIVLAQKMPSIVTWLSRTTNWQRQSANRVGDYAKPFRDHVPNETDSQTNWTDCSRTHKTITVPLSLFCRSFDMKRTHRAVSNRTTAARNCSRLLNEIDIGLVGWKRQVCRANEQRRRPTSRLPTLPI